MQLTKNFHIDEFTLGAGVRITPTAEQVYCMKVLCSCVLQPVRNKFGPLLVTSGLRNNKITKALRAQGYPASATSDHYAWSRENPRGTGAADFTCPSVNEEDIFLWLQQEKFEHIGQIIYYPDSNIIHVSNRFSKIFTADDTRREETRVMKYINGSFTLVPRAKPATCGFFTRMLRR